MKKVCHITTVHPARDNRIFYKECKSLAKAGFDVKLVVVNGQSFTEDGVEVIGVPCQYSGRLQRFLKASKPAYLKALEMDAEVYHFHDPEFLPYAAKLVRKGKKVIYDVHEDLPRQLLSKHWIPKVIRSLISLFVERWEDKHTRKMTHIVTATVFISDRFHKQNQHVTSIKNYPVLHIYDPEILWDQKRDEVCYVGSIAKVRGISELIEAMALCDDEVRLNLAGKFVPPEFKKELEQKPGWKQVNEIGFADREKVAVLLQRSFAGIVTLHPVINYLDALPVKMFEYMAAGIPVIASDFPLWRQIMDDAGCGICVDPMDPESVSKAIAQIRANPAEAELMGRNGRKAVIEKYNWEIEEKKLVDLYQNLLQS
ncbi:MAG: glycosyltransferase family 4 protein [Bacteroidales bacterium]|nr:glycosyltransferase family 4 protein [Bacteroidales bacterium]